MNQSNNSRYTLQVQTDDANLMFYWRVSMEACVPFTAENLYEYYQSRSGIDQALRECRETTRRLEHTEDDRYNELCTRLDKTETAVARTHAKFAESRGKLSRRINKVGLRVFQVICVHCCVSAVGDLREV